MSIRTLAPTSRASIHEQIPLDEKNAVVTFDLKEGRRKDALPEAQVANVAKVQNAANRALLAQQLAAVERLRAARELCRFAGDGRAQRRRARLLPPRRRSAIARSSRRCPKARTSAATR